MGTERGGGDLRGGEPILDLDTGGGPMSLYVGHAETRQIHALYQLQGPGCGLALQRSEIQLLRGRGRKVHEASLCHLGNFL